MSHSDTQSQNPDEQLAIWLNERRSAALTDVDTARFSWFQARVCAVAGVGFFTDAYDLFAINSASTMLGYVYGPDQKLTANQDLGLKIATPIGTLFGQLVFGWLADVLGRKRMYGIELVIMIIATFVQALAGSGPAVNIIGILIFWRFILGVGIGGDYPSSAIISSEFAPIRIRGRMMNTVFACQGGGSFTAALVAFVLVSGFKSALLRDDPTKLHQVDLMWRLLLGLGCVPGVIALYFRLTIPETPRFTMDIERNVHRATAEMRELVELEKSKNGKTDDAEQCFEAPRASWVDFKAYFSQWKNMKILIGTAYSWFALDIAFYGLNLNSSSILKAISFLATRTVPDAIAVQTVQTVYDELRTISLGNLILSAGGLIPGYWACFLFIDSWGRKPIQLMGFSVLTVLFIIMGFAYDRLIATNASRKAFIFLYCLANFFSNFGPNTTTFIVPGEAFPTRYRSTAHGISAASGKLGAIIAQVVFDHLKDRGGPPNSLVWVKHILQIFALFMLTGIASTLLIPETKNKSLEKLSNESQDGFIRGSPYNIPGRSTPKNDISTLERA